MDISKYFPSINKDILIQQLQHIFKDKKFIEICRNIINSYVANKEHPEIGIAIVYFPSQWFGNFYLDDCDRYIRNIKGITYYCRYIDDMVLFSDNKQELHKAKILVEKFLKEKLNLILKPNYQIFSVDGRALDFVGYIFYRNYTILRRRTAIRTIKQSRTINKIQKNGYKIDFHTACGFLSRAGQRKHFSSYNFTKRYIETIDLEKLKEVVRIESSFRHKTE